MRLQLFSQKSLTATVPKVFQIGLCGVVEANLELFWNSWSVGFLGERLYVAGFLSCSGGKRQLRGWESTAVHEVTRRTSATWSRQHANNNEGGTQYYCTAYLPVRHRSDIENTNTTSTLCLQQHTAASNHSGGSACNKKRDASQQRDTGQ